MTIKPEVFKQVRKALGLTQQELADAIGLSRVTINKMEQGRLKRGIPDEIANRLLALKAKPAAPPQNCTCPEGERPEHCPKRHALQDCWRADYADKHEKSIAFQEAGDDGHLWDNEEDES